MKIHKMAAEASDDRADIMSALALLQMDKDAELDRDSANSEDTL